ncbi:cytokinin hydroxylase [Typha latifolia]|uniref:cytokinin hydroxylase n=1 Tax=Typha latifolia TaxID=4733 RepID=UPI003C2D80DD
MQGLSWLMGILLALLPLFLYFSISILWQSPISLRRRLRANGFYGPPPSFPLGNLIEMSSCYKQDEGAASCSSGISHDIHSSVFPYFARWRKSFGKIFVYWLGTEPFLYIADPEFLKMISSSVTAKRWGKPEVFKRDRKPMFGKGLVMVEGDDWHHHRHIIAPAFSMTNLNAMISLMEESTTKMLDGWSKNAALGQNEVDVERDIIKNAAEIIAKTSFGINEDKGKKVYEKLQAMQAMLFKTNRLVGVPFSKFLYAKQTYKAWKLGEEIDGLLLAIIESRKQGDSSSIQQQDLLGFLLAGNQEKLTTRELVDECKTFFFGGHETTGLALSWTLLMLALHPEWQTALREEIIEITKDEGALNTTTMLSKLTKMGWVLNEMLRLYSPAPNAQRQAREAIKIGEDIVIPKGTNIWVDVVGMHHDPELWGEDANEFKPERWFKEGLYGGCKHRMGFLPFGFGGRMCVGKNLTLIEYKVVLSLILRRFALSVSPHYKHSPRIMLSLRPSSGIQLVLHPIEG